MSMSAIHAVIEEHCRALKLPTVLKQYPELARQAQDGGMDYADYLKQLLEAELIARRESTANRRLREAHFPEIKTLDQIDWKALEGVARTKVLELTRCEYLAKAEDVIIAGPIGTGKTLLATIFGVEAAKRRHKVAFIRAADLVRELKEARDDRTLGLLHRRYSRAKLLIIDELGFVPFERSGGELLFNLLSDRYEKRSTIVTTNLSFSEWVQVFGDEKLTTALLDRLGHHSHILTTRGQSYRTRAKRSHKTKNKET